jgi:hypothetical protein
MNIIDLIMQAFSKYLLVHRIPMYTGQILVCLTSCWEMVQDNQDNDSDGTISRGFRYRTVRNLDCRVSNFFFFPSKELSRLLFENWQLLRKVGGPQVEV